MLRSFYGIDDQDPEQLAREKIAGRSLLLDPAFAEDLPLIFDFLGVPDPERPVPRMDPEGRQRALADFLCRLVSNPARRKILVLVVEDLHWIDEGSQAMLNGLVEGMRGRRRWSSSTTGPSTQPAWTGSQFETIALQPLDRADTAKLLRDLAGADPSLDGIDEPIHERTERQPVLHRGDRPRAGRVRLPAGRARRLPAGEADRGRGRAGHRPGRPRRPHRPPRPRRQEPAAGRLGGRQGGQRRGAVDDRRPGRRARRARWAG